MDIQQYKKQDNTSLILFKIQILFTCLSIICIIIWISDIYSDKYILEVGRQYYCIPKKSKNPFEPKSIYEIDTIVIKIISKKDGYVQYKYYGYDKVFSEKESSLSSVVKPYKQNIK